MSRVFVSHAPDDWAYCDQFVNLLLMRGACLSADQIFYSSGSDTGVASGAPLLDSVRTEVNAATLVIALVTPRYQARPACIAELGAAWAMNRLFPVMAPKMQRSKLEGVLPNIAIRSSSEPGVLDELADRITSTGHRVPLRSWGVGKKLWLDYISENSGIAAMEEHDAGQIAELKAALSNAREALDVARAENNKMLAYIASLETQGQSTRPTLRTLDEESLNTLRKKLLGGR